MVFGLFWVLVTISDFQELGIPRNNPLEALSTTRYSSKPRRYFKTVLQNLNINGSSSMWDYIHQTLELQNITEYALI